MAVRSRRLALLPSIALGAWTAVYTVPAGRTAIVKHVVVVNTAGAARDFFLRVRSSAVNAQVWRQEGVPAGSSRDATQWQLAINPGDVLEVFVTGTGTSTSQSLYVAGALLEGEPA